ncbi:MAG: hypothetical protein K6G13_03425 [Agathobacter sp.]|uniref:hypothetical protein n=1 Tax=Agathobacter sp. TaxID=2021311 RepID=UPI0025899B3A|nr:hypothetical protein [Agathobacter sp.]MCR5677063.1 hypothetical protein [Agathobacter sp.]
MAKRVKSFLCVCVMLVSMVLINPTQVQAANVGWNLRFIKGAPSSENILSWRREYITKTQRTSLSVSKNEGNAEIFLYTSNGIATIATKGGTETSVSTRVGIVLSASVKFLEYDKMTVYAKGNLRY